MAAVETCGDLVPLRTDFDLVWRGCDPAQVGHYVREVETDLRLLAADRDAAVARADDLARQLESARSEVRALRARVDDLCRVPVDTAGLDERLSRRVELAEAEAVEITTRAEAAAERTWREADEAATRLRRRHEALIAELDARRREAEAEHRDLTRRTRERVEALTREAVRRRRELDEQAAEQRRRVEADFALAMAGRRAEAARAQARLEAEARARADAVLHEATERAERMVAQAQERVDVLRAQRDGIASALLGARRLLDQACPALDPLPGERGLADGLAAL